jgi:hypothetical protein
MTRLVRHLRLIAAHGRRLDVQEPTKQDQKPQTRADQKAAQKAADWARLEALLGRDRPRR